MGKSRGQNRGEKGLQGNRSRESRGAALGAPSVRNAGQAETNPGGVELVVTALACSLVEKTGGITFTPGSRLHTLYAGKPATEGYRCSYGLNPAWRDRFEAAGLRFTGFDETGEVRAGELPSHPFFIGTLFQPELSALRGERHPMIAEFVRVAAGSRR